MSLSPDAPIDERYLGERPLAVTADCRPVGRLKTGLPVRGVACPGLLGPLGVGVVAFFIAALASTAVPFVPRVHDEFSYLLAADTLLHGRLANPAPAVWQPFQSFHILVEPAYVSKYPLGIGALVAIGWAACGSPIVGCWIAAGLCAASMVWMLGGVTNRRWAICGGLLVACHPAMQVGWSQSLMSGWLTACGSSLLMGGVFRLRRRFSPAAALVGGLGVAVLALSRPFEGLVATGIAACVLWQLWSGWSASQKFSASARSILWGAAPVVMALGLIGLQNMAATGSVSRMPYQVHEQKYGVAPLFVFGQPRQPTREAEADIPAVVRDYHHGWSLESFNLRRGAQGWLTGIRQAGQLIWSYWFEFSAAGLLTCVYWLRFSVARLLVVAIAVQVFFSAMVCWVFPHYLAPVLPWLLGVAVLGLRRVAHRVAQWGVCKPAHSHRLVLALLLIQVGMLTVNAVQASKDPQRHWAQHRASIQADLAQRDGLHLVLVHYGPQHNVHQEWVYNTADLATAKVLWAHGNREDWNAQLQAAYGANHFIWQIEADRLDAQPQLLSVPSRSTKGQPRLL